jgi:hypothetical protein
MSARVSIRAAVLKSSVRPTQSFSINGVEVELRTPSVQDRSKIYAKAMKGDTLDTAELSVAAALACTFVQGTDEKVFEEADREVLKDAASGSDLDKLMLAAAGMINPKVDDVKND